MLFKMPFYLPRYNPQELKLCTSARLPVIEPMIVPQKAQLVGVNECTYGPSYWCQSYENAKKCKVGLIILLIMFKANLLLGNTI